MTERVFELDPTTNEIHVGTWVPDETTVATFCGLELSRSGHSPAPSMTGYYMCKKCVVAESIARAPKLKRRKKQ
jgi:hypothetical protein